MPAQAASRSRPLGGSTTKLKKTWQSRWAITPAHSASIRVCGSPAVSSRPATSDRSWKRSVFRCRASVRSATRCSSVSLACRRAVTAALPLPGGFPHPLRPLDERPLEVPDLLDGRVDGRPLDLLRREGGGDLRQATDRAGDRAPDESRGGDRDEAQERRRPPEERQRALVSQLGHRDGQDDEPRGLRQPLEGHPGLPPVGQPVGGEPGLRCSRRLAQGRGPFLPHARLGVP